MTNAINTPATYTVFRSNDWSAIEGERLTLKEAVEIILETDGYAFEIRIVDGLFELFVSDGSSASPRGARNLRSCAAGGFVAANVDALYRKIIHAEWRGYEAMTDESFADMQAQAAEEEGEE